MEPSINPNQYLFYRYMNTRGQSNNAYEKAQSKLLKQR